MKLRQLDRRFLAREEDPEDIEVARTNGCYVYDERGRRYIDFLSGWCVGNFGWGNSEITKRARRRRPDYVNPEYLYRPWVELAQLLAEITPGKLEKTYRATGGSVYHGTAPLPAPRSRCSRRSRSTGGRRSRGSTSSRVGGRRVESAHA